MNLVKLWGFIILKIDRFDTKIKEYLRFNLKDNS